MSAADGGPAFPTGHPLEPGMTLRDWFAGQAPRQIEEIGSNAACAPYYCNLLGIKNPQDEVPPGEVTTPAAWSDFWYRCEAAMRYRYADAMLAERAKVRS